MPTSREAIETIIATIPGFRPQWQRFLEDWQGEATPWYLVMGEIAHYVVDEYEKGDQAQLITFFSAVELILGNADSELQISSRWDFLRTSRTSQAIAALAQVGFVIGWVRKGS